MIIDEKVMTLHEVSEYLKVHPSTIYRHLKQGLIPAFKVGSDWRFNIESIDRWRLNQEKLAVRSRAVGKAERK